MESTRASSKGQMVIPKAIRDALDIRTGTELRVELTGEGFKVSVKPADRAAAVLRLAATLAHRARPITPEAERNALSTRLGADDERIKNAYRRRR